MTGTTQERWERGTAKELRFWNDWVALCGKEYAAAYILADYVQKRLPSGAATVRIADLGSGAWSRIGSFLPGRSIKVTAADIFGERYMAIWRGLGMTPAVPIEKQDMMALTYPDASFDIVHCSNALDHTVDPFRAIAEMKRVLRPGGWLLLRHLRSVARQYRYGGLHQWNISPKGNDVLIWSDHEPGRQWLSALLPGVVFSILPKKPQRLAEWRKPSA